MMEKMTRAQQKQQTRLTIFNAAVALFKQKGYEQVTIAEIASDAKVSVGIFYVHFKTKQDIVSISYYEGLNAFMVEEYGKCPPDYQAIEKLEYLLNLEFQFADQAGVELTTLAFVANLTQALTDSTAHFNKRTFTRYLQEAVVELTEMISVAMSPDFVFKELESAVRGMMATWCFARGTFDIRQDGKYLIQDLLVGLQLKKG